MDIIVTIPKKELSNIKKEDVFAQQGKTVQYWSMFRKPTNLNIGDKVYFIENGLIKYYQTVINTEENAKCEVTGRIWHGFNLVLNYPPIYLEEAIVMKGFQGFRYKRN